MPLAFLPVQPAKTFVGFLNLLFVFCLIIYKSGQVPITHHCIETLIRSTIVPISFRSLYDKPVLSQLFVLLLKKDCTIVQNVAHGCERRAGVL